MHIEHPSKKYLLRQIESATPGILILMLFDGAIRYLNTSKDKASRSLFKEAFRYKANAQDVIYELSASLNMKCGTIAQNLYRLYDYMMDKLIGIDMTNKYSAEIDEVINMLTELRDTWKAMIENSNQKNNAADAIPHYA